MIKLLLLTFLLAGTALSGFSASIKLYVSPVGKGDKFTVSAPGSLWEVRKKIRSLNDSMQGDIIVYLLNGEYICDSTFTLTAKDSGKNGFKVIYTAFKGAQPVISGGKAIKAWTLYDKEKNIYRAAVPASFNTRDFYVNAKRAQRARGKNQFYRFTKTATGFNIPDSGVYAGMSGWKNLSEIEVVAHTEWRIFRCPVSSITDTDIIIQPTAWATANDGKFGIQQPDWIENAYELLDEEGEWYLDKNVHYLYYKPHQGENINQLNTVAGNLQTIIEGCGTPEEPIHHIWFHGITFAYTTWLAPGNPHGFISNQASYYKLVADEKGKIPAGVTFKSAHNILFERNMFVNMGNSGLEFWYGSQNNIIASNTFLQLGGSAIDLGGIQHYDHHPDRPSLIVKNNKIVNNYITQTGQTFLSTAAILIGYTANTLVEHNHIHDLPYTGISLGWGWGREDKKASTIVKGNIIQYNLIHHYMNKLKDGGGIYVLGDQPETLIAKNYIHNSAEMHAAIYLDNGTKHVVVENNVVEKMFSNWLFAQLHVGIFATDNIIQNNFSDTPKALIANGNTVLTNTIIRNAKWPKTALHVIRTAGQKKHYQLH